MKGQCDFSKGERGKFYRPKATFNRPVYLDRSNLSFVRKLAKRKDADLSSVVNELIRSERRLAKTAK